MSERCGTMGGIPSLMNQGVIPYRYRESTWLSPKYPGLKKPWG